ncbi:MAG TPA: MmgE/PrpD family protein [bacterium]|nr:MmgE/PrpD family protein [bacterium]HPR89536.1 MmgE/PrpD family protein [bacterium]
MSITRQMARFALSLQYDAIPEPARKEARRFLLDSFGCALAALHNEDMAAAHRYIEKLGGVPDATVIGSGLRTNAPNAALMNSLLIRAIDYNDIYWKQDPSHPSDLIPAALAAGEKAGGDVRDLIAGILIAYELEMRWCLAATPGVREVGWHHATLTQFVSPFVAARLLRLSEEQTVAAAGISGSSHFTLGGVVAGHLTNMKNTADPMATEAGVAAALLASENYTGPVEVIEGKEGLYHVLHNVQWSTEALLDGLGEKWLITECGYKPFPTEALTHQPISAALQLREQQHLTEATIARVLVRTTTRGADILSDPSKYKPTTKETADHSLPYCIAAALVDGHVLPSSFDEDKLADPRIWSMLGKIKVVADAEIDRLFPGTKRAIVEITDTAGRTHTAQVDHAKGSPENPMSDAEVIAKFAANAEAVMGAEQRERLIEATWELGTRPLTIRDYMQLVVV